MNSTYRTIHLELSRICRENTFTANLFSLHSEARGLRNTTATTKNFVRTALEKSSTDQLEFYSTLQKIIERNVI